MLEFQSQIHFHEKFSRGSKSASNDVNRIDTANLIKALCETIIKTKLSDVVHMNVVPRSTGNTNSGTREPTLKCKF